MFETIYQGTTGTKTIELCVRKYRSNLPYFVKVNGRMTFETDEMRVAYIEYNESFNKED